jgi:hypothetical protein
VQWARRAKAWDDWAQYQIALASKMRAAGDLPAATAAARDVWDSHESLGVALSPARLFQAAHLLCKCAAEQKAPWQAADWDAAIARFPPTGALADQYLAYLQILRLNETSGWSADAIKQIDGLVQNIEATNAKSPDVARLQFTWRTEKQKHAAQVARELEDGGAAFRAVAVNMAEALVERDALLPESLKERLDQLKTSQLAWGAGGLQRWERAKLCEHLAATMDARMLLAVTAFNAVVAGIEEPDVRAAGLSALQLTRPEIAKECSLAKNVLDNWTKTYPQLREALAN